MTPALDPKLVAVSALAVACFSVGFSVTAAAYGGLASTEHRDTARDASPPAKLEVAPTSVIRVTRGCHGGL
jgi:hypothetical protein